MNPITITPICLIGIAFVGAILIIASFQFGKKFGRLEERSNRLDNYEAEKIVIEEEESNWPAN